MLNVAIFYRVTWQMCSVWFSRKLTRISCQILILEQFSALCDLNKTFRLARRAVEPAHEVRRGKCLLHYNGDFTVPFACPYPSEAASASWTMQIPGFNRIFLL